ncbi:MAG: AraC family transcriptional regulator [Nitrospira sp.]|nr:AraC family transcriptional regulator [Nitrospira sp.]
MNKAPDPVKIHLKSTDRLNIKRSIYSTRILAEYAKKFNIPAEVLLYNSKLSPGDLTDPEMFITPEEELKIFRRAISLIPDPKIGLEIGKLHNVSAMSRVAIPAIFCDTFLDAINIMFRYIDLTQTYCQYELTVKDNLAVMSCEELIVFGDLRRFLCERDLVSAYTLCCNALGAPLILKEITLTYPRPEYAEAYQDIFNCPITFNADKYQAIFDKNYLTARLPLANALTKDTYEKDCKRAYARLHEQKSTLDRIQQELLFPYEEPPCFDKLARRLNMSTRTLRRHLAAEGISYKNLLNDIRKKKALELISSTNMPIEGIATELGYKDVANFYHAFRNWTGTTPSSYRKTKF